MDSFDLILEKGQSIGYNNLLHLHSSISARPSRIGSFLTDESARAGFLEKFPAYIDNLLHFLVFNAKIRSEIGRGTAAQSIVYEVLTLVVSILSHSEFKLADTDLTVKLIIAALKQGLSCQPPPPSLKDIAAKLSEEPGFLEYIASSEDGADVINSLFSVHFINTVPSIANAWAQKLFELCFVCTGIPICHNIVSEVEKWRKLNEVTSALEELRRDIETSPPPQYTRTQTTGMMRRLSVDDKKSSLTRSMTSVGASEIPPLPDRIVSMLDELQLKPPRSSRMVDALLDRIRETEISALVRKVLSTFPCRPCNELSRDPQALRERGRQAPRNRADSGCFVADVPEQDTLFGSKIGLWKMLLSAEAFKDIQRQVLAGMYSPTLDVAELMLTGSIDMLESRLRKLASGDWKRGNLSKPVGTAAQKKHLPSPLLRAEVGRQLQILWQVDFGPCEDGVYRQHIKSI